MLVLVKHIPLQPKTTWNYDWQVIQLERAAGQGMNDRRTHDNNPLTREYSMFTFVLSSVSADYPAPNIICTSADLVLSNVGSRIRTYNLKHLILNYGGNKTAHSPNDHDVVMSNLGQIVKRKQNTPNKNGFIIKVLSIFAHIRAVRKWFATVDPQDCILTLAPVWEEYMFWELRPSYPYVIWYIRSFWSNSPI